VVLGNQEKSSERESFQKSGQTFPLGQAIGRVLGVAGFMITGALLPHIRQYGTWLATKLLSAYVLPSSLTRSSAARSLRGRLQDAAFGILRLDWELLADHELKVNPHSE